MRVLSKLLLVFACAVHAHGTDATPANLADKRQDVVERITASYEQWNGGNIEPLWPTFGAKAMPAFSVDGVDVRWTF